MGLGDPQHTLPIANPFWDSAGQGSRKNHNIFRLLKPRLVYKVVLANIGYLPRLRYLTYLPYVSSVKKLNMFMFT
jgi:hypothetical protein